MTNIEQLDVVLSARAQGLNSFPQTGAAATAMAKEVGVADTQFKTLSATQRNVVVPAHEATAKSSANLEEAMHHGSITLGEYGQQWDGLSRKLGGVQGLMNSGLGLGLAGLAGAAALGLGVAGAKSAVDNAEQQEKAYASLAQAAQVKGESDKQLVATTNALIATNTSYIANQYEAVNAMAMFTRAGFDQKTATEALQVSINLAALKGISLTDSAHMVDLALMGNGRSVRELGVDLKSLSAEQDTSETAAKNLDTAQKNVDSSSQHLAVSQQSLRDLEDSLHAKRTLSQVDLDHLAEKQAAVTKASSDLKEAQGKLTTAQDTAGNSTDKQQKVLAELAQKTDAGTDSVTRMEQSQNRLNRTWQDASVGVGKTLVPAISNLLDITDLASRSVGLAWEHPSTALTMLKQQTLGASAATDTANASSTKYAASQGDVADGVESVVDRMARLQSQTVTLSSTTHSASEHLDEQAQAATAAGGAHQFLRESVDTATRSEDQHNQQVARYLRQEPDVTKGLGETAHLADTNADSLRLAALGMDSFNNATRAAELQTGISSANIVQGINDIKEVIDHTKQDRLEIQVDASAVNAALQNLLALQQAASRGVNVSISTAGDLGPGNGLLSGLFGP
jgi:hypothetical protein